ncbi:glycosyltransferase family 39 protein [Oleiagrimonas sp. C23AA]|uniref:ArnT family glycosyltransferase n=1 Tax=Oleiagrimonas sp. C23AA TaxID=2719047 RepID=UPI00141E936D|nr:glycosyltransferase family 39 protein [Oleiagrimonas sp. C23AA]NII11106.1 glycosyltransferase family 39 protein [Oleiagrimonas sp. C23AA]
MAWLLLVLCVLGFGFQGTRALWSTDEGRYTENALQMIDSGNYLVPAYNQDRVNFTKPPVTYWLIAGSMRLFGRTTWAARLPYALAFIFTALLLCGMGRWLLSGRLWLPGLIYGCSLVPFLMANVVSTDGLLVAFEALATYGFLAASFGPARKAGRYLVLMWLGFGLAFLTKGPPGLMPLLGMLPFVYRKQRWPGVRALFAPLGLVVFLLVGLGWYALVVVRQPALVHYFLHYEIYNRIFTPTQNRHPQWYGWFVVYAPVLVLGSLPWWRPLARVVRQAASVRNWRDGWAQQPPRLFLWLWFLLALTVFCLARSRLPAYVLPLFIPLSLLVAMELEATFDMRSTRRRVLLGLWMVALLVLKGGIGHFYHPHVDNRVRARSLGQKVAASRYAAVTFIEATDDHVAIEEHTPWGMRLYLRKPVYAIAWNKPGAAQRLCRLVDVHSPLLVAADASLELRANCPGTALTVVGDWRGRHLLLISAGK